MMNNKERTGHDREPLTFISHQEKLVAGRNLNSAFARICEDRSNTQAWTDLESAVQESIGLGIRECAPGGNVSAFDQESIYTEIHGMVLQALSDNKCRKIASDLRERIEFICKYEIGRVEEMPKTAASKMTAPGGSPVDVALASEIPLVLQEALKTLFPNDRQVLQYRYGLGEGSELTVGETAEKMNISKKRVSQLQQRGMDRLRTPIKWQLGEI
jgi:RNA polymerase sigma factor (sigma-70 family)